MISHLLFKKNSNSKSTLTKDLFDNMIDSKLAIAWEEAVYIFKLWKVLIYIIFGYVISDANTFQKHSY
jgi:hypothetical protein